MCHCCIRLDTNVSISKSSVLENSFFFCSCDVALAYARNAIQRTLVRWILSHFGGFVGFHTFWVLFENRPALYFCNYILITAYIIYIFYSVSKILFKIFMYKSQRFY